MKNSFGLRTQVRNGAQRGTVLGAVLMLASMTASAQKYQVVDLGQLSGGSVTVYDLNAAGIAVGAASGSTFAWHGFRWQDGSLTDLGELDGGSSYATAINADGDIVGAAYRITTAATDDTAAVTQLRAVLLPSGISEFTELPSPEQTISEMKALDIDDAGNVVGYVYADIGDSGYAYRGFVWQPDTGLTQLAGVLEGGGSSVLRGVNSARLQAVGYASKDGYLRAVRIDTSNPDLLTDLGTLGGNSSQATALNDAGVVVGWASTANDASTEGFYLPAAGAMQGIGQLDSMFRYSKVTDINNAGVLVGSAQSSTGTVLYHAVVYDTAANNPGLQDLNALIDCNSDSNERWTLTEATAINDQGQIVGYGAKAGVTRAFLLNPVNDNSDVISCADADAAAYQNASGAGSGAPVELLLLALLFGWRWRAPMMRRCGRGWGVAR